MNAGATIFLVVVGLAAGQSALAQEYPDIRGIWEGPSETIVVGTTNHHSIEGNETESSPRLVSVPVTVTIDQQNGRRYSGTVSSPTSSERIVGVIGHGGRLLWVDEDGFNEGVLIDDNTMDICYLLVGQDVQLASCVVVKRKP